MSVHACVHVCQSKRILSADATYSWRRFQAEAPACMLVFAGLPFAPAVRVPARAVLLREVPLSVVSIELLSSAIRRVHPDKSVILTYINTLNTAEL